MKQYYLLAYLSQLLHSFDDLSHLASLKSFHAAGFIWSSSSSQAGVFVSSLPRRT